ncbi:MAG: agmatine deiminase family protein [Myxococcales bacterium]|nr:agmatine deiminase family protein [Myxococcales bacterium]
MALGSMDVENRSMPAEWERHDAFWSAWPVHRSEWGEYLPAVQEEVLSLFKAIVHGGRGEVAKILVRSEEEAMALKQAWRDQAGLSMLAPSPYGDIWLRDTGPIFVRGTSGLASLRFEFNGWGNKYQLEGDLQVAEFVQAHTLATSLKVNMVLEGGAIDVDGAGTLLTTKQCLLAPNRNPGWTQQRIENELRTQLGVEEILWLQEGLKNDHTDGHVDTLARFVERGTVVCMRADDRADPNYDTLKQIALDLRQYRDAQGAKLQVETVPSPGAVCSRGSGTVLPASYMNFYISNTRVVVPTYGVRADDDVLRALESYFPGREVIGSSARALLEGGGAFHCITQQEPQRDVP